VCYVKRVDKSLQPLRAQCATSRDVAMSDGTGVVYAFEGNVPKGLSMRKLYLESNLQLSVTTLRSMSDFVAGFHPISLTRSL